MPQLRRPLGGIRQDALAPAAIILRVVQGQAAPVGEIPVILSLPRIFLVFISNTFARLALGREIVAQDDILVVKPTPTRLRACQGPLRRCYR